MKTNTAARLGVRGRVWLTPGFVPTWTYEVRPQGRLIFTDFATDYDTIQRQCQDGVTALCRVLHHGYRLKPKNWHAVLRRDHS